MSNCFLCGAAKEDITPSEELLPWLFGLMDRHYDRIHDHIFVRVAAFQSGINKALIVVFDLDKATNPENWIARIKEETGIPEENILYLAIHTHEAPLTGYRPFEGPNFIGCRSPEIQEKVREYEDFLFRQLLDTVKRALGSMVPARFGYGRGSCDIGMNRCQQYDVIGEDGSVKPMIGLGYSTEGPKDNTLLVFKAENAATSEPIVFLSNYAVHCVAGFMNDCGNGKSFLSGDIGGAVSRVLETEYPGSVALWTSAPAGDINPVNMIQTNYPDPVTGAPVQHCVFGEDAAETNINAMAGTQIASIREVLRNLNCNLEHVEIRGKIAWAKTLCSNAGIQAGEQLCDQPYEIRLHLLQLGPLALIGADGELFTSHGKLIKQASPVSDTFVLNHEASLLQNNPGYVLDDETFTRIKACEGRNNLPGNRVYTAPGTVNLALKKATIELFR